MPRRLVDVFKSKGKDKPSSPQSSSRIQPQSYTQDGTRTLCCLIDGDSTPFDVTVPITRNVSDLNRLIWEEKGKGVLHDLNAADLTLWKVLDLLHIYADGELTVGSSTHTKEQILKMTWLDAYGIG